MCTSPVIYFGPKYRTLSLLNVTSLDLAHYSRPVEIICGLGVWGSWFYPPKQLLSLQVSFGHKFESVFCILIRTKLEPGSMVLETSPLVGQLSFHSTPFKGHHLTSYTCTWLYEGVAYYSPSNQKFVKHVFDLQV